MGHWFRGDLSHRASLDFIVVRCGMDGHPSDLDSVKSDDLCSNKLAWVRLHVKLDLSI